MLKLCPNSKELLPEPASPNLGCDSLSTWRRLSTKLPSSRRQLLRRQLPQPHLALGRHLSFPTTPALEWLTRLTSCWGLNKSWRKSSLTRELSHQFALHAKQYVISKKCCAQIVSIPGSSFDWPGRGFRCWADKAGPSSTHVPTDPSWPSLGFLGLKVSGILPKLEIPSSWFGFFQFSCFCLSEQEIEVRKPFYYLLNFSFTRRSFHFHSFLLLTALFCWVLTYNFYPVLKGKTRLDIRFDAEKKIICSYFTLIFFLKGYLIW